MEGYDIDTCKCGQKLLLARKQQSAALNQTLLGAIKILHSRSTGFVAEIAAHTLQGQRRNWLSLGIFRCNASIRLVNWLYWT